MPQDVHGVCFLFRDTVLLAQPEDPSERPPRREVEADGRHVVPRPRHLPGAEQFGERRERRREQFWVFAAQVQDEFFQHQRFLGG